MSPADAAAAGRRLDLVITTPTAILVHAAATSVRAEDDSGGFGILPGHTDFITVLSPSVVRWRTAGGDWHFCAHGGGVLRVEDGARVAIACRTGSVSDDLATLEAEVAALRAAALEAARKARVEETRLHARAVRQMMRYLRPGPDAMAHPPAPGPVRGGTS